MNFDKLIKHRTLDFKPQVFFEDKEFLRVKDLTYLNFLKSFNGGFFYSNSLHIFGQTEKFPHHDLNYINNLFKMLYGELAVNINFFAEDIFGNPFGYYNNEIIHFNLETSDKEIISKDFEEWLIVIDNDLDYFTGQSLSNKLSQEDRFQLAYGKRLGAKYPFILGGDYTMENLVLKGFEENIDYNSSIAKQIVTLPDGSEIKLNINS